MGSYTRSHHNLGYIEKYRPVLYYNRQRTSSRFDQTHQYTSPYLDLADLEHKHSMVILSIRYNLLSNLGDMDICSSSCLKHDRNRSSSPAQFRSQFCKEPVPCNSRLSINAQLAHLYILVNIKLQASYLRAG